MWRRWLIGTVLLAVLSAVAGCQSTGNFLTSLPFAGGAPTGQTEPELTFDAQRDVE